MNPAPLITWAASIQKASTESERIPLGPKKMSDERLLRLARFTIDHSADAIFWSEADGHFLYVNDAACRLLGYTSSELLKLKVWDIYSGLTADTWQARVARIKQDVLREESASCRHRDGRLISVEVTVKYQEAEGKQFMCAYVRDITERKHAADALQTSELNFHLLFQSSRDAIMTLEPPDWQFTSGNPASLKMFGANSEEEFLSHGPGERSPERQPGGRRSAEKAKEMIEVALREGSHTFEWMHRRIGGELFPADVLLTRMEQGRRVMLQATVRDISERRRTEENHSRLVKAIEQAAETVMITNLDGTILYVNPAFEKSTGYTIKEAVGSHPRILKSGMQSAAFYRQMWEILQSGEVWHGRFVNKKKDGTLYTEDATISPVRDAAGRVVNYIALKLDVTREIQLEDQLRHSQKLEAVARLSGGIAHDFNNLLTVINGYSALMLDRLPPNSPDRSALTEISHAGSRAAALTRQLLAFSRKQIIQPAILDLNVLMTGLGKLLTRLLGEDIEVDVRTTRDLGKIKADPGQIEQVLMNLCINARDAMPGGGKLSIETLNVDLGPEHKETRLDLPPGQYVMLTVSDTGCGMDEKTQSHLFEPFFTTKEVGKGTGLGLSTVYGIVTRAGGRISCQSAAGKGTTFVLLFPRCEESDDTSRVAATRHSARGSETILLVEDDNTVRALARVVLERYGYRVLEAFNGQEALKRALDHPAAIDLLVTDMVMPGMNGLKLIEKFSLQHPDANILIMSGYTQTGITDTDIRRKGMAYLQKPFQPEALAVKVRSILDRRAAQKTKEHS